MTHVITQNCCNDAACVPACPVNCIHPTPDEPDYATAEMLYIDPAGCIDCGACVDACPVDAIARDYDLPDIFNRYQDLNARYFQDPAHRQYDRTPAPETHPEPAVSTHDVLRVAIVGSGPAACYAAECLLSNRHGGGRVKVDMFERLSTPWGLVRFGVAPDHQGTKAASDAFQRTAEHPDFRLFLDVEVGTDIEHSDLAARYHGVVYAVGAMGDRPLGIPGEDLPGSHAATDFVGWYNGHPDHADRSFDLSGDRAVVVGNGNVAVDVARVLLSSVESLRRTDIADHALQALSASRIREVLVVGRRGPAQAAFTTPELLGLHSVPGLQLRARPDEVQVDAVTLAAEAGGAESVGLYKARLLDELVKASAPADRVAELRFCHAPIQIVGGDRVRGIVLARNTLERGPAGGAVVAVSTAQTEELSCSLILRAVGYRGAPVADLPFDLERGTIPHVEGRVVAPPSMGVMTGVYVTGWIKRGPAGVIGTNRRCATETVGSLMADWRAGRLDKELEADISERLPDQPQLAGWNAIDRAEKAAGEPLGRPRVKIVDHARLRDLVRVGSDAR